MHWDPRPSTPREVLTSVSGGVITLTSSNLSGTFSPFQEKKSLIISEGEDVADRSHGGRTPRADGARASSLLTVMHSHREQPLHLQR